MNRVEIKLYFAKLSLVLDFLPSFFKLPAFRIQDFLHRFKLCIHILSHDLLDNPAVDLIDLLENNTRPHIVHR